MSAELASKVTAALDRLDTAIDRAAMSCEKLGRRDTDLVLRIQSYKEVVFRQRLLAAELTNAASSRQWREVTRLSQLIQAASVMVRNDAQYILTALSRYHDRSLDRNESE